MIRFSLTTILLVTLLGCEPKVAAWTRSELYFGLSTRSGQAVNDDQWEQFLREVVTPRFPDGLTVVDASGQYRDTKGTLVKEPSKILIVWRQTTAEEDRKLDDIRKVWRERFDQESVLRIDQPSAGRFD
ncbi:MAG TPA: DUF3574 domain-containing protein [Tepidisphaeraceae bacterium]|nr:DUF3574 domain-containing protein [Tepidisphaeraceae bacterium]